MIPTIEGSSVMRKTWAASAYAANPTALTMAIWTASARTPGSGPTMIARPPLSATAATDAITVAISERAATAQTGPQLELVDAPAQDDQQHRRLDPGADRDREAEAGQPERPAQDDRQRRS